MYNAAGQINKDQLVQQFAPLVKRIAHHLMSRLPSSVQVEDLVQNGMIGLLDALGRFEAGVGAQFETYAAQRVRGAMLDGPARERLAAAQFAAQTVGASRSRDRAT
jgi:RNA polymerase sigma factor for flagellar operon FliA